MNALFEADLPFTLFNHNVSVFGHEDIIIPIRSIVKEILSQLPNDSFDIIYQDGNRILEHIFLDIELAKPKVKDGGYLVGDDLAVQAYEANQKEMYIAIDLNIEMIKDSLTGQIYMPGLSLAVSKCFEQVGVKDGFWWVNRDGKTWKSTDYPTISGIPKHILKWL